MDGSEPIFGLTGIQNESFENAQYQSPYLVFTRGDGTTQSVNIDSAPGNSSNWALYPAVSDVNMNGKNINNLATINANNMYILNTGTGDSLRIDDQASDTTYFKVDSDGRCGVATGGYALTDTLTVNGSIRLGDANLGAGHFKGVNVGWYVGNNTSYPLCTPQSHENGLYLKRISGNYIATQLWTAEGVAPGNGVPRLTVMPVSGNMGIGTEDPQAKLHILQTGTQDAFRVDDVASDTTYFRIDADGHCGVNTGSAIPLSDIFNVYGAVRVREAIDAQEIRLSSTPESAYIQTNAQLRIGKIATPTHTLNINTDTMRVGIGSSAPSAKLHIINTDTIDCLRIDDQASDTTYFKIDENGRCGINTGSTALTSALTVSGAVDVMNNKITGVATPTTSTDVANKAYVDSVSAPSWAVYTASQAPNIGGYKIQNVANPTLSSDVANKQYVDGAISSAGIATQVYFHSAITFSVTYNSLGGNQDLYGVVKPTNTGYYLDLNPLPVSGVLWDVGRIVNISLDPTTNTSYVLELRQNGVKQCSLQIGTACSSATFKIVYVDDALTNLGYVRIS